MARQEAARQEAIRQAELQRQAEQQRQEQIAREQELQRLAQQQEVARVAQEQQAARLAAEEAARVQEPVGALTPVPEPEPSVKEPIAESPEPVGALTPIKEEPMYTSALPSEERNIVTALPGTKPEPGLPVEEPVVPTPFVEGADVPASTGLNMGALDELFANLRKTEELQKMALEPGLLQQGFTGATGAPSAPTGTGIYVPQAAPSGPAIDFNVTPEMAGALQAVARPAEITAAERAAVTENPRVQALNRISGLLEADDFRGAFDAALQAEQDLGGDFIGNLVDPNKMKMLRGPMDANEIAKFYNEMPESVFTERYLGPGNEFKKEQAIERNIAALGGEAGYADPTLGVKKEETLLGKLPIKELATLAAIAMGATAIPGLFGAGTTGGTAAGGATAAGGTTAAGGATAAGATAAGTAAAAAPLAEVVITASKLGLTIPQAATLLATTGAGVSALGGGAAPTAPTTPTPETPLDEVVVTGKRALDPALRGLLPTSLASTNLVQGVSDIPTDIYGQPEAVEATEQVKEEPFENRLDEVVVTGSKYQPGVLDLAKIGTGGLSAAELLKGFTEPTLRPYEKVVPEGEPMDEVIVKGTKPSPIDLAGVGVGGLTAAQLLQGFTQPKVDPFTGETKQPSKTEQELDKIQDALKKGTPIPGTGGVMDRLRGLLDQYGSLENALKLLGALGSAGASSPKAPTGGSGIGTGGMGGALPKYTYTRQQLSPDIDYYTYGTRPEAKFFDYTTQLEKPVQPELPPAKPPEPDMVMATGGLTGYAKGGSKSSRYVDGPGSGREDKIPALLSDGEYVIDAETLALLGDGSTKEGARRMDKFRANIRKHKGRALSRGRISPNAKSPSKYMGGGLT
jgi:hypothetical protein